MMHPNFTIISKVDFLADYILMILRCSFTFVGRSPTALYIIIFGVSGYIVYFLKEDQLILCGNRHFHVFNFSSF